MKNIFIVYGHYDQNSFNSAIKNTFTEAAQKKGHTVDCVDLYNCLLYTSPSPRD